MWTIIFVVLATLILVGVTLVIVKSDKKFHDKSLDVKEGMDEGQVREIMEDDPLSTDYLQNGEYAWTYERKYYKGWGMVTVRTEIIFNVEGKVKTIHRSETLDKKEEK